MINIQIVLFKDNELLNQDIEQLRRELEMNQLNKKNKKENEDNPIKKLNDLKENILFKIKILMKIK